MPIQKLLMLLLLLTLSAKPYAQTKTDNTSDVKDSIEIMKDLMDILADSAKTYSYFTAEIGIGNRMFNVRNNALNSKLSPVSTFIYSPSLGYHHKSGFYFSAGTNLLKEANGFGISQYLIAPGYELVGNDNFDLLIAYTHYFVNDKFSPYVSPVQNDFYGAVTYKKPWIRPGIAVGYSTGEYGDVKRQRTLYDSTNNKLKSFSIIASAAHEFLWDGVFNKNDGITFTPALMFNAGSSKIAIQHKTNAINLANFLNKKGRLPKFSNTKFQAESAGLSLDLSYAIGKFTFEPETYFDYYLPSTQDKKLYTYFTFTIRYLL